MAKKIEVPEIEEIKSDSELFFLELVDDLTKASETFKNKLVVARDLAREASDDSDKFKDVDNFFSNQIRDLILFPLDVTRELKNIEVQIRAYHVRQEGEGE